MKKRIKLRLLDEPTVRELSSRTSKEQRFAKVFRRIAKQIETAKINDYELPVKGSVEVKFRNNYLEITITMVKD